MHVCSCVGAARVEGSRWGGSRDRRYSPLFGGYDEGVYGVEGEGEEDPKQRGQEETAEDRSDGVNVKEAACVVLGGPGWTDDAAIFGLQSGERSGLHRFYLHFLEL